MEQSETAQDSLEVPCDSPTSSVASGAICKSAVDPSRGEFNGDRSPLLFRQGTLSKSRASLHNKARSSQYRCTNHPTLLATQTQRWNLEGRNGRRIPRSTTFCRKLSCVHSFGASSAGVLASHSKLWRTSLAITPHCTPQPLKARSVVARCTTTTMTPLFMAV